MVNRYWNRWPLTAKLTLIMTLLVTLAVLAVTSLNVFYQQQAFQSELEQQADLLLDGVAVAATNALYRHDVNFLDNLMQELEAARVEPLNGAKIYDGIGRLIVDSESPHGIVFSLDADPYGERLVQGDGNVFDWQPDHLIAARPILLGRQRMGAISIDLSTNLLQTKMDAARNQGLLVALAAA